ncbi:MAG: capsule assembly Wzi family protein [Steroidobacteraceae bacterium]
MRKVGSFAPWLLLLGLQGKAFGAGVTPYLPLNLEPEIESQIERVLILGDQPVMTRPIAAATVLEALPKACKVDAALCQRVQRYLARYTHGSALTHASIEGAASGGVNDTLPNSYGMRSKSTWAASAAAYVQPSDYLLIDLGAVAYEGRTNFTGSMISLGSSYAQLDLGFRPHWFSPMTDSSMLMSTEAPTLPSVTLSNYEPFTRLGLRYEIFDERMSKSDHIAFENATGTGFYDKTGYPKLFGVHLSMEPVSGWSFGLNRLLQYGGAGRPASVKDLFKGFFNPSAYDNTGPNLGFNQQFGNQQASVTSSFLFPGKVPFAVYAEYAGEDTSHGRSYLLGNSALSVGIHFPRLWERFDLTFETSEWQNAWYVHSVYQDGMTNYGFVTGHWGADQRVFGNDVVARTNMVRLGWDATFGGLLELRYRTLQNENYGPYHYDRYHELTLAYSRPWHGVIVGGEVDTGQDSFGSSFSRVAGFIRYDDLRSGLGAAVAEAFGGSGESDQKSGELFVDAGANRYRVKIDLENESQKTTHPQKTGYHFAVGARRAVSEHNDLGTRVELDDIEGHSLIGVRLIDYRYRFNGPVALDAFLGAARYALGTPAYGFYYGFGAQWRNVLPGWDVGVDLRYDDTLARDHLLPTDPQGPRPDSFYYVLGAVFSISYHF